MGNHVPCFKNYLINLINFFLNLKNYSHATNIKQVFFDFEDVILKTQFEYLI